MFINENAVIKKMAKKKEYLQKKNIQEMNILSRRGTQYNYCDCVNLCRFFFKLNFQMFRFI